MSQNKKIDHFCTVCNKGYHSCDLCKDVQEYQPWRSICCTQRHYQVYIAISSLRGGIMTPNEVKEYLERVGVTLDEIKTFIPAVQEILLPIMEEVVIESELYQVDVNDQIESDNDEIKPQTKSKRK